MTNWLLLRGLGRDQRHWYKFPEMIKAYRTGDNVITINLPGLDGEKNPPYSIEEITNYLKTKWEIAKREYPGDWNILAISLGGMMAIDWCHRYPTDFKNLYIINSSSKSTSTIFERMTPLAIKTLLQSFLIKDHYKKEKLILNLITNTTQISDKLLNDFVDISKEVNVAKRVFFKQLFAASKFELPEKLDIPMCVFTSKADRFTSYKCSQAISKKYNARLFIHETAGHDLPLDRPEWIIERLS